MDTLYSILLGKQALNTCGYFDTETIVIDDGYEEPHQVALKIEDDKKFEQIEPKYNCYHCKKTPTTLVALRKHHRKNHKDKPLMFKCKDCDLWFQYLKHLIWHQNFVNHEMLEGRIVQYSIPDEDSDNKVDNKDDNKNDNKDDNNLTHKGEQDGLIQENKKQGMEKIQTSGIQTRNKRVNYVDQLSFHPNKTGNKKNTNNKRCRYKGVVHFGQPTAQRQPLKIYDLYTEILEINDNSNQGIDCDCPECMPNKKASITMKQEIKTEQNQKRNIDQVIDQVIDEIEVKNEANKEQDTQQQDESQKINLDKATQSLYCVEATRFVCLLCVEKSYSSSSNLKRHFTQKHKGKVQQLDQQLYNQNQKK